MMWENKINLSVASLNIDPEKFLVVVIGDMSIILNVMVF